MSKKENEQNTNAGKEIQPENKTHADHTAEGVTPEAGLKTENLLSSAPDDPKQALKNAHRQLKACMFDIETYRTGLKVIEQPKNRQAWLVLAKVSATIDKNIQDIEKELAK